MLLGQVMTTFVFDLCVKRMKINFEALFQCSFLFNGFNDDKSDCSMLEYRWRIFKFEVGERDFFDIRK